MHGPVIMHYKRVCKMVHTAELLTIRQNNDSPQLKQFDNDSPQLNNDSPQLKQFDNDSPQ